MTESNYNTRDWLNPIGSYATSYISCFDGTVKNGVEIIPSTFISISDCYKAMRIYKTDDDTLEEFVHKLDTVITSLELFKSHLINKDGN